MTYIESIISRFRSYIHNVVSIASNDAQPIVNERQIVVDVNNVELKVSEPHANNAVTLITVINEMAHTKQNYYTQIAQILLRQSMLRANLCVLLCIISLISWSQYEIYQNNEWNKYLNDQASPFTTKLPCETINSNSLWVPFILLIVLLTIIIGLYMYMCYVINCNAVITYNMPIRILYDQQHVYCFLYANVVHMLLLVTSTLINALYENSLMHDHAIPDCKSAQTTQFYVALILQISIVFKNAYLVFV